MVILAAGFFAGLWWLEGLEMALRITGLTMPLCFGGLWLCRGLVASESFRREMAFVFLLSFVLHIWSSLLFFPLYMTTALDPNTYMRDGLRLAHAFGNMPLDLWQEFLYDVNFDSGNQATLSYVMGMLVLAKSPLWICIFHSFLAALEGVLLARIALRFYSGEDGEKTIRLAVWMLAVFPLSLFWTGQVLKDPAVAFLTILFVDQVLAYFQDGRMRRLLVLGLVFWITARFRFYFVPILLGASAAGLVLDRKAKNRALLLGVLAAGGVLIFLTPMGQMVIDIYQRKSLMEVFVYARTNASSPEVLKMAKPTVGSLVKGTPMGFARLYFSPLPLLYEARKDMLSLWQSLIMLPWFALFPFFMGGVWFFLKEKFRQGAVVWMYLALYTLFFSMIAFAPDPLRNLHVYPVWLFFAAMGLRRMTFAHPLPWAVYFVFLVITINSATTTQWVFPLLKPLLAAAGLWFLWLFYNARLPGGRRPPGTFTLSPPESPEASPGPL